MITVIDDVFTKTQLEHFREKINYSIKNEPVYKKGEGWHSVYSKHDNEFMCSQLLAKVEIRSSRSEKEVRVPSKLRVVAIPFFGTCTSSNCMDAIPCRSFLSRSPKTLICFRTHLSGRRLNCQAFVPHMASSF